MRPIPLTVRLMVLADLKDGYSQKVTASRRGVSVGTIRRLVAKSRWEESKSSDRLKKLLASAKPGPPPALTPNFERLLIEMVNDLGPRMTTKGFLRLWQRVAHKTMCQSTMRSHLRRLGIRKKRALGVAHRVTPASEEAHVEWWSGLLKAYSTEWLHGFNWPLAWTGSSKMIIGTE